MGRLEDDGNKEEVAERIIYGYNQRARWELKRLVANAATWIIDRVGKADDEGCGDKSRPLVSD